MDLKHEHRPAIYHWTVVVAGFLQHEGTPNGMVKLWSRLHSAYRSSSHVIDFQTWDFNYKSYAELIWRLRPYSYNPSIHLVGYSWGGTGCARLAEELDHRGMTVDTMVLSDPVYRHKYWAGNWRAFVNCIPIKISDNVEQVHWFRQKENWPKAHELSTSENTKVYGGKFYDRTHAYMDDLEDFHEAALDCSGLKKT